MANTFIYRLILFVALFTIRPLIGLGNDGSSRHRFRNIICDTVPPPTQKPAEQTPANTKPDIIKVVPKSRKQTKPIAIPNVPVKPIKIIKPKVIKRIGIG